MGFEGGHESEDADDRAEDGGEGEPADEMAFDAAVGDEIVGAVMDFVAEGVPDCEPEKDEDGAGGAAEKGGHPGAEADTGVRRLRESEAADGGGTALAEGGEQGGEDAGPEFGGGQMLPFFGRDREDDADQNTGAEREFFEGDGGAEQEPFDDHGGGRGEAGDGEHADARAQAAVHGEEGDVSEGEVEKSGEGEHRRAGRDAQGAEESPDQDEQQCCEDEAEGIGLCGSEMAGDTGGAEAGERPEDGGEEGEDHGAGSGGESCRSPSRRNRASGSGSRPRNSRKRSMGGRLPPRVRMDSRRRSAVGRWKSPFS